MLRWLIAQQIKELEKGPGVPGESLFDRSETDRACRLLRQAARHDGVTETDNLPFLSSPPGAHIAVLLVHGFTATPWEMRPLAEHLADAGIASLAVRLPGHGTSPEDLGGRRWEEWASSVDDGYRLLDRVFPAVYGMGMSTGSLLLLNAALTHPLRGLVLFSPYLGVLHRLAPYAGWLRWLRPYHEKPGGKELYQRYYNRRPVAGIHQINRLIDTVRRQLPQVTCPVLAFNGEGDQTVDIDSGRRLVDLLGGAVKIHMRYGPDVPHVLTGAENPCRQAMFGQATRFVQELEKPGKWLPVR